MQIVCRGITPGIPSAERHRSVESGSGSCPRSGSCGGSLTQDLCRVSVVSGAAGLHLLGNRRRDLEGMAVWEAPVVAIPGPGSHLAAAAP